MLTNLIRSLTTFCRVSNQGGRKRHRKLRPDVRRVEGGHLRRTSIEPLEERRVLSTTVYIEFGNSFPLGGLQMTAMQLRDSINGPDINSQVFSGGTAIPLGETITMTQDVPLSVQADILPIVQRAFEPYDIDVVTSAVTSIADIQALYAANAGDPTGEYDAWIPVVDIRSTVTDAPTCNFSVGCIIGGNFGLGGLSPTIDIGLNANTRDDAPLIFSDRLAKVASSLAWGIAHEVGHSLSLQHLDASNNTGPNATLLTGSEIMKQFGFQQYDGLFGRFDFPLGNNNMNPATTRDHYARLASDPDIGLRDDDANGTPDLAYATGTGAHDEVILDDQGGQVDVDVNAYSDSGRTNLFASDSYSIDLTTDTEGEILVHAGINNDEVRVDATINAPLRLVGGTTTTGGISENDLLTLVSGGLSGTFTAGPDGINGNVSYAGGADVDFSEFENVEADNVPIDAITLDLSKGNSVEEGEQFILTVEFENIDTLDSHDVVVEWGNGETAMTTLSPGDRDAFFIYQYPDDHPMTGTASDGFTINVTVTDDDGDEGEANAGIVVNNVAPDILNIEFDKDEIDEAETVTVTGFFGDPALITGAASESWTGTALWSDGVATALVIDQSDGTFETVRTFLDDHPMTGTPSDTFTVDITIDDDDLGTDTATSPVLTVNNLDPVITSFESDATFEEKAEEGEPVNVTGTFTDAGILDTHEATVDWGDGTVEPLALVQGAGFGSVSGSHAYDVGGVYEVTMTLTDDDTGTDQSITLAVITGVGLWDGTLYIVGTNELDGDHVSVHAIDKNQVRVHADFIDEPFRTYDLAQVDLIVAYLCEGDDQMTIANSLLTPAIVHGGGGNDHLVAGGGPTVLLGDSGDDTLVGGHGRNVLIGGAGLDRITAGNGDDVLVGGSTDVDNDDDALQSVLAAWDADELYDNRVTAVDGLITVLDDGDEDKLTGASGLDLFFDALGDVIQDRKPTETLL